MPSSATTSLRLEKPAGGEKVGLWDDIVNLNYDMLEASIAGTTSVSTTGGTTTLTNVDYINDQAKKRVLYVSGTLVSNATVVVPNASKTYVVINATAGAYTLTIKTASGSGKEVTQGSACEVYCDGSNVILYVSPMVVISTGAPSSAAGAAASSVAVTPTGNLASTNAQSALAELQGDIDTINAALPGYQPLDADLTTLAGLSQAKGNTIVGNGSAWSAVTVGSNGLVMRAKSASSSGVEWAAGAPAATVVLFSQTAAPTGWTKDVTAYNHAIRLTGGTVTTSTTTGFSTRMAAGNAVTGNGGITTLDITQIPAHTHGVGAATTKTATGGSGGSFNHWAGAAGATASAGSSGGHNHGPGDYVTDLSVSYFDCIRATAD